MSRLLYEHSVSHCGYLIIPYQHGAIDAQSIYSYKLLSEFGHKGRFHKADNPAGLYSSSIAGIMAIAQEHLSQQLNCNSQTDYFKRRYTYRNTLIIVFHQAGKYFYDHYPPEDLHNIAAPKIFATEADCLNWIKQGLDRHHPNLASDRSDSSVSQS
jgi:hypothetical protein